MKKILKKIVSLVLVLSILLIVCAQSIFSYASDNLASGTGPAPASLKGMTEVKPLRYDFLPMSADWKKLVANEAPVEFTKVKYKAEDAA